MRLRGKTIIAFQSLAAIVLVAGGMGIWQITELNRAARRVSDVAAPHLYAIKESQTALGEANLILNRIGAGLVLPSAMADVEARLDTAQESVEAILDGGSEILGQVTTPATSRDIIQPLRQMVQLIDTLRSLADQQMDALERFGSFSTALEGRTRNTQVAYTGAAEVAEGAIVSQLISLRGQMRQTAQTGVTSLAVATLLSIVVASILGWLFSRDLVRRVRSVMRTSGELAQGNFDCHAEARGRDELADMAENINTAGDDLGRIISKVLDRIGVVAQTGDGLRQSAESTQNAVGEISGIVQTNQEQNDDLVANVTETSAVIEEMARNIESLDSNVQQQSSVIEESSASIEELISSIENISTVSGRAQEQLKRLSSVSDAGRDSLDQQDQIVGEMSQAGDSLLEANELIASVASQTNLLAMNAAIEAAHAGEAGRGFAVVADEIRKLAEATSEQSNQVKRDLDSLKQLIERSVEGSKTSSQSFSDIQEALTDVRGVFDEIYSAMEQQRTGGSEILEALSSMRDMTSTVHQGSSEMKNGNDQMLEAIRNVNDITQRSHEAMQNIAAGMETIRGATATVQSVSARNQSQIGEIIQATDRLTIPERLRSAAEHDESNLDELSADGESHDESPQTAPRDDLPVLDPDQSSIGDRERTGAPS